MRNNHDQMRIAVHQAQSDMRQSMDELYKHYRSSGIALMVFLITLNGAIIVWLKDSAITNLIRSEAARGLFGITLLAAIISIWASVWTQLAHFQGAKFQSCARFAESTGAPQDQQQLKRASDRWYAAMDIFVMIGVWGFMVSAMFAILLFLQT